MARGINKAIIVGTLGHDPSTTYTHGGAPIATLSVATNEQWADKQTGQKQERTEWHRVIMFGKLAEIAIQYLKKGSQAYFEGKLQTRKWKDKTGNDRYTTEIIANQMQMLGSKPNHGAAENQPFDVPEQKTTVVGEAYRQASQGTEKLTPKPVDDGFDIPF